MDIVERIKESIEVRERELKQIAPQLNGEIIPGDFSFSNLRIGSAGKLPNLKGIYNNHKIFISFSNVYDLVDWYTGLIHPRLEIDIYKSCPFIINISHREKTAFVETLVSLHLEPKGLLIGMIDFDEHYLVECKENEGSAKEFLIQSGVIDNIRTFGDFSSLIFNKKMIKLIFPPDGPKQYLSGNLLNYVYILSSLAESVNSST